MDPYAEARQSFRNNGAMLCKSIISPDIALFLTHVLLRKSAIQPGSDDQVPDALAVIDHDLFLETVHETIWPQLESLLGERLLPTYTYSRLYTNGNVLDKHTDRPACEISVTVQLGRSHHYTWPIYAGGHRFDLAETDGVIYKGCEIEHWRERCDGPPGYYSGQAFFHFVRANGPYAAEAGDSSNREISRVYYVRDRINLMINK